MNDSFKKLPISEFARHLLEHFPDWSELSKFDAHGNWSIFVASPTHPSHTLWILTRDNSVEVIYDDASPPGPAEKLFVGLDQRPAEVALEVGRFILDLMAGRVVVVRKRLGRLIRWLRRNCDSIASFESAKSLNSARQEVIVAIYSWADKSYGIKGTTQRKSR